MPAGGGIPLTLLRARLRPTGSPRRPSRAPQAEAVRRSGCSTTSASPPSTRRSPPLSFSSPSTPDQEGATTMSETVIELPLAARALAHPREIPTEDWNRFEGNVAEILARVRFAARHSRHARPRQSGYLQALHDATDGYDGDPKLLDRLPDRVPWRDPTASPRRRSWRAPSRSSPLCEHHALPFFGRAYVAYIAHEQIIGISKLTRLVRVLTRRFGVQERIDARSSPMRLERPHGSRRRCGPTWRRTHLCTQMRGVEERSRTITTFWRGAYRGSRSCAASSSSWPVDRARAVRGPPGGARRGRGPSFRASPPVRR